MVHALLWCSRGFGEQIPWEGTVTVQYDDSIITDTAAEKAQDMAEVAAGLKAAWEYRCRWFGEDEATARRLAGELGGAGVERQAASDGARGGAGGPSGRV